MAPPSRRRRFLQQLSGNSPKAASEAKLKELRASIQDAISSQELQFLPAGKITALASRKDVEVIMDCGAVQVASRMKLVDFGCKDGKRLFLAIVLQDVVDSAGLVVIMKECLRQGINDDCLPIMRKESHCRHGPGSHVNALIWKEIKFGLKQYECFFISPIFKSTNFIYKPDLPEYCVLPFTSWSKGGKDGHFSTVYRATLHPDHFEGEKDDPLSGGGKEIQVALKELKHLVEPGYNVGDAWNHEASSLEKISKLGHRHLIRPLSAFRHGSDRYYIMFEWSDGGSLRDAWGKERENRKDLSAYRVICLIEQLIGLTEALCALHNTDGSYNEDNTTSQFNASEGVDGSGVSESVVGTPSELRVPTGSALRRVPDITVTGTAESSEQDSPYVSDNQEQDVHWRHGDLKPENILLFKGGDPSLWLGTLKIADLGLAKQHMFKTTHRNVRTEQKYTTSQYEAPEVMSDFVKPRSRRYDIWSMGCIILEFVILLLYGYNTLEEFYKEREGQRRPIETMYFTVTNQMKGTTEVSQTVGRWIKGILGDTECSREGGSALGDLVMLVRDRLLVIDLPERHMTPDRQSKCRADASELREKLRAMLDRAKGDPVYLFSQQSRHGISVRLPPPSRSRRTTEGKLTSNQFLAAPMV